MVELDDNLFLDSTEYGSPLRFAAHSCSRNTARPEVWNVGGELRLVLVATQDLAAGTEVTWNYASGRDDRDETSLPADPHQL
eukprot:1778105-Rhodomonas_salina.2